MENPGLQKPGKRKRKTTHYQPRRERPNYRGRQMPERLIQAAKGLRPSPLSNSIMKAARNAK